MHLHRNRDVPYRLVADNPTPEPRHVTDPELNNNKLNDHTLDFDDIITGLTPARRHDVAVGITLAAHYLRHLATYPVVDRETTRVLAIALDDAAYALDSETT